MCRIVLLAPSTNELLAAEPASSGQSMLILVGLVLAVAAVGLVSTLVRMLAVALAAALGTMSSIFSLLGRTVGVGLVGLLVVGVMVWGGGDGGTQENPAAPTGPSAAAPR